MKKGIKMIGTIALSIVGLAVLGGGLFLGFSPEFGGKHSAEDIKRYEQSEHYNKGVFQNLTTTKMDMSARDMASIMKEFLSKKGEKTPDYEPPFKKVDSTLLADSQDDFSFVWFGHSTFFLKMGGKKILLDPMFSDVPAPHPALGKKRFQSDLPIDIEQLPTIDYVFISHDHYDHLDYQSIKKLKEKVECFFVPLGVGAHLRKWGVDKGQIQEFNWWEEHMIGDLQLAFTPARHFSGRGLSNRFSTLWGSWVIKNEKHRIFFCGDSGYDTHFKEIGEKYGPFDIAFMECGQYNDLWCEIHMMPEETAVASKDLKAKYMMPIHWGAFSLAMHPWTEPVVRVQKKAREIGVSVVVPMVGEYVRELDNINNYHWWESKN